MKWNPYKKSFLGSLAIHVILLSFFIFSFGNVIQVTDKPALIPNKEIVQAVVVDQSKVDTEIKRLQIEEAQKVKKEKLLAENLQKMQVKQKQEKAKLDQLKKDMAKAKKEEEKRLSDIRTAHKKEQAKLDQIKQQQKQEQNKLEAIDDARQAEQDRLKQAQIDRAKEEKKRSEQARLAAANAKAKQGQQKEQALSGEMNKVLAGWKDKIQRNRRIMIEGMSSDLCATVAIQILPDGSVRPSLVKSSGNPLYDDLSIKAIYKSEPLELPEDPEVRSRLKNIEFRFLND